MLGRIEYLRMPDDDLISKPVTPSATAGSTVFALQITTGSSETASSTGSLGLHIVIIDR